MDKEVLDLYYDHYKETCTLNKEAQARRNKSFVILCVLEALSFLVLIKPDEALKMVQDNLNSKFDITVSLGFGVFQTLLWILIAYVLVRYCQDTLQVERNYKYLDQLEKKISSGLKEPFFSREGDHYLTDYPMVLNFLDLFYKMFSPILFVAINIVWIRTEWLSNTELTLQLICDSIIFGAIIIITWFYFFEIHSEIANWFKKHIKPIGWIAEKLRKILKEV